MYYNIPQYQSVYKALKNISRIYIFISSDSIYDVCELPETDLINETMSIRYSHIEDQKKAKSNDSYGHVIIYLNSKKHKLCCEEFLLEEIDKESFPFIILRLPDVIGPYDDTGRFFSYILWMTEFNQEHNFELD